ncbi:hypothetical protein Tco_1234871 [Tanacetum coccineum]
MGTPTQYLCDYWSGWVRLPRFVCGLALILVLQLVGPLGKHNVVSRKGYHRLIEGGEGRWREEEGNDGRAGGRREESGVRGRGIGRGGRRVRTKEVGGPRTDRRKSGRRGGDEG